MVRCERCGKDSYLPFRCSYCGGYFCDEHRLPEAHECTGIISKRTGDNRSWKGLIPPDAPYPFKYALPRRRLAFTHRELRDLAVSVIIVSAIPLTWLGGLGLRMPLLAAAAVGIFTSAFLLHELAHKLSAQSLGYWAEFRINIMGLLLTLLSFLSPLKVVAPGAVVVAVPPHSGNLGWIALAGPLTNIVQGLTFLILRAVSTHQLVRLLAEAGVSINAVLALFNLIPAGSLDGKKILIWSPKAWIVSASAAGLLLASTLI